LERESLTSKLCISLPAKILDVERATSELISFKFLASKILDKFIPRLRLDRKNTSLSPQNLRDSRFVFTLIFILFDIFSIFPSICPSIAKT
jgi:hypothetical protein